MNSPWSRTEEVQRTYQHLRSLPEPSLLSPLYPPTVIVIVASIYIFSRSSFVSLTFAMSCINFYSFFQYFCKFSYLLISLLLPYFKFFNSLSKIVSHFTLKFLFAFSLFNCHIYLYAILFGDILRIYFGCFSRDIIFFLDDFLPSFYFILTLLIIRVINSFIFQYA